MKKTTVSWSKVDWNIFNTLANQFINEYYKNHPFPTNKIVETYYMTNAIKYAFQETAKELPWGCRPDPICWCTNKLEELLEEQNEAWEMAMATNNKQDWTHFNEIATEFAN